MPILLMQIYTRFRGEAMPIQLWSRVIFVCAAAAVLGGTGTYVNAQQNSMFGGSGPLSGVNGTGTATTPGMSMGTGVLPLPSNALPTSGLPGMANTGMGAAGAGATGVTGQRTGLVGQANTSRLAGVNPAGQQGQGQNQLNRQGQN